MIAAAVCVIDLDRTQKLDVVDVVDVRTAVAMYVMVLDPKQFTM